MKRFTKTVSLVCSMAMLFTSFSVAAFAGENDGDEQTGPIYIDQTYIDNLGGQMPVDSGSYILRENVKVSVGAKVETQDANIVLDLSGYTITYTGEESMYVLGKIRGTAGDVENSGSNWSTSAVTIVPAQCVTGVVLTINDSGENGTITGAGTTGKGSVDYWINGAGVGTNAYRGGCILIEYGCKMILNGGTITAFEATEEGGAICASNGAELEMHGGTIENCTATSGGAIAVHASSASTGPTGFENIAATFTMTGGTIRYNTAKNKNGVNNTGLGGGIRINRCNFYLSGGEIYGNDAETSGGGIDLVFANQKVVAIQGSPKIYDNTFKNKQDTKANLYIQNTNDGDKRYAQLNGSLNDDAVIYFGTSDTGHVAFKTNGNDYNMSSFHSDRDKYDVCENNGNIKVINTDMQYSVGIGGEISLLVKVKLAEDNANNAYVETSYKYTKGSTVNALGKVTELSEATKDGDYYTFSIPIESACMTAPINVTVHAGNNVIKDSGVTIEKYAKVIKDKYPQNADLCDAMLIFGGYAQVQLNINTDNLPTVGDIDFVNDTADYGLATSGFNTLPTGVAGNLSLLSQTEIKLRFAKADLGDTAPAMTITGYSETIEGEASGNYYIYTIKGPQGNGFNYSAYDTTFDFTVGDISGTYSVYDYLRSVKSKSTSSAAWKNLVEAYYHFAEEVKGN